MNRYHHLIFIAAFVALLCGSRTAFAGENLISENADRYNLAPHVDILRVKRGDLTPDRLDSPPYRDKFIPHQGQYISAALDRYHYWIRFKLPGPKPDGNKSSVSRPGISLPWFLELDFPTLGWIDFYVPLTGLPDGGYKVLRTGVNGQEREATVLSGNFVLPVSENYDPARYFYLRIKSSYFHKFNLTLWTPAGFQRKSSLEFFTFGSIYGAIVCMIIYNLFLYFSLKDNTYLLYVFYISSMLLYEICVIGHIRLFVTLPPGFQIYLHWFFLGSFCFWAALFSRSFLSTRTNTPFLDKLLNFYLALAVVQLLSGLTPYHYMTTRLAHFTGTVSLFLFLAICLSCLRKKVRQVRFYFLAWGFLMFGLTWFNLTIAGVFAPHIGNMYILALGTVGEATLLSFALGDRIRILREQREQYRERGERYKNISMMDGLTRLFNRRFMMNALNEEIEKARNTGLPLSILMIDVDDFKKFNDRYGHLEGDKVLIELGESIKDSIRSDDLPCRYGGEEFTVILPQAFLEDARNAGERIRKCFQDQVFQPAEGETAGCSVSVGAASLKPGETEKDFLRRADEALYRAKQEGKNRVVLAGS